VRGPVNHRFVRSIYFRDPNGHVIELTASTGEYSEIMDPALQATRGARALAGDQEQLTEPLPIRVIGSGIGPVSLLRSDFEVDSARINRLRLSLPLTEHTPFATVLTVAKFCE